MLQKETFASVIEKKRADIPTPPTPKEDFHFNGTVLYSAAKKVADRSGAKVQDMLTAHAFAFANNMTYGGSCSPNKMQYHQEDAQSLIDRIGLTSALKFACPEHSEDGTHILASRDVYAKKDTAVFTPEWRDYLQHYQIDTVAAQTTIPDDDVLNAVVHIRRGDVVPCLGKNGRYSPNGHYKLQLERFVLNPYATEYSELSKTKKKIIIKIHSELMSFESWNYTWIEDKYQSSHVEIVLELHLDDPLPDTWHDMMTADILILSKSSFSFVPAMLNFRAEKIIYPRFWHRPLKHWTEVYLDKSLFDEAGQLKALCDKESKANVMWSNIEERNRAFNVTQRPQILFHNNKKN